MAFFEVGGGLRDIWVMTANDRSVQPFLATRFNEGAASFSPDGRWLAYVSNESGRPEIYVQPYPGPGGKWQISTAGANFGAWGEGGRSLLYGDLDGKIFAVDVTPKGPYLTIGPPRPVFGGRSVAGTGAFSRDGRRVLLVDPSEEAASSSLVLTTDWTQALPRE